MIVNWNNSSSDLYWNYNLKRNWNIHKYSSLFMLLEFQESSGLSMHRGPPVNVPIRRTAHLISVIPENDTKESMFGHQNFSSLARGLSP